MEGQRRAVSLGPGALSETLLRAPGEEGHPSASPQSLQARDAYEYPTLWGSEESSVLIGIRKQMGSALDLLFWERRHEGRYRRRSGGGHADAYSRCLIAKVQMDQNVLVVGQTPHCDGPAPPQPPRQQQVAEQTSGFLAVVAG